MNPRTEQLIIDNGSAIPALSNYTEEQLLVLEKHQISCCDVEDLFGEYVDGALPPSLVGRLDQHVAECEECQSFKADYLRTIKLARELADRPVPQEVSDRLRDALSKRLGIDISSRDSAR